VVVPFPLAYLEMASILAFILAFVRASLGVPFFEEVDSFPLVMALVVALVSMAWHLVDVVVIDVVLFMVYFLCCSPYFV